jgi:hypothetical protein
MMKKLLLTSLVLCLSFFGTTRLSFAGQVNRETPQDPLAKMMREGWKPVTDGVLQRTSVNGGVESFAFGVEGFTWMEAQMQAKVLKIREAYTVHPSKNLAKAIDGLRAQIARVHKARQSGTLADSLEKVIINGCDIAYGASGGTGPVNSGGATATASAYFHNNCGYSGDTYAYAHAVATQGSTTTTVTQTDPKTGTWIDSYATATAPGNINCESDAYAAVTSSALGISFSYSPAANYSCFPPISVTISGPSLVSITGYTCKTVTWTANVTGGASPYSYSWTVDGYSAGTGSTYSETYCGDNFTYTQTVNVQVSVTDSLYQSASNSASTSIRYSRSTTTCDPYAATNAYVICPQQPY